MRLLDRLAHKVEHLDVLDDSADAVVSAITPVLSVPPVKDVLSGTQIGHPLHPLLVTLPIGSWTAATLLDFTGGDAKAAQRLIGFGVVTAAPTIAAGVSDWTSTHGPEQRVGVVHAAANGVALALYSGSWVARARGRRGLGMGLALAGAGAMSIGGWLGGHLSYALGVGVDTTAFEDGAEEWTHAAAEADITDDMTAVTVAGVSVLLTRVDGKIVALGNRCTHRGAPLNEGERSADCVRCPWHESVFGLVDGTVVEGPATRPQSVYDVRVIDGSVEIKRASVSALQSNPV